SLVPIYRSTLSLLDALPISNIVNIYDVGEEDHILYMVMEYVDGMTLKEYIQQNGPLDVSKAIAIMKQITSAITHAHENNIVYREDRKSTRLNSSHVSISYAV